MSEKGVASPDEAVLQTRIQADVNDLREAIRQLAGELEVEIARRRDAQQSLAKEETLLRQLLEMHERQRQWAACKIHDDLAQPLAAALMYFEVFQSLPERFPELNWDAFRRSIELLRASLDEARRLMSELRPPILDEFGVAAAIEHLIAQTHSEGKPEIAHSIRVQSERFDPAVELAVYRFVEECLGNALRYSQSERIEITLVEEEAALEVRVEDWGVGFDLPSAQLNRFGLEGLKERVRMLGGQVTIDTAPNLGTRVHARLPLGVAATASLITPAG